MGSTLCITRLPLTCAQRDLDECWTEIYDEVTVLHEKLQQVHHMGFHFRCQEGIRYCVLGELVAQLLLRQLCQKLPLTPEAVDVRTKAMNRDLAPHIPTTILCRIQHLLRHLVESTMMFKVLADEICGSWTILYGQDNDVVVSLDGLAKTRELHCCLPAIVFLHYDGTVGVACRSRGGNSYL